MYYWRLTRYKEMRDRNQKDNIYKEGSTITAKDNPELKLVINRYCQRIYYCSVIGDEKRQFAYFERNLIAPAAQ
jgi:hypothetical protein